MNEILLWICIECRFVTVSINVLTQTNTHKNLSHQFAMRAMNVSVAFELVVKYSKSGFFVLKIHFELDANERMRQHLHNEPLDGRITDIVIRNFVWKN